PMLHLGRRITLGVDVADLLQLERALEGYGKIVAASQVQKVVRVLVLVGELLDVRGVIENLLDETRERTHGVDDLATAQDRHIAQASELQREEEERHHLARER